MSPRTLVLATALLAVMLPGRAWGQSIALSTAALGFPPARVAELDAGAVTHPGFSVAVDVESSTTSWTLSVRSDEPSLRAGGKALADLEWRIAGSSTWTPMSSTDRTVATGMGDTTIRVEWRARLGWGSDPPGDFGANVTFTVTGGL